MLYEVITDFAGRFVKTSGAVLLNETLYGIGAALVFSVYGRIGTAVVAGADIARTIENLVWIFFWSLCAAASVSVGKLIGEEKYEKAKRYGYKFIVTGLLTAIVLVVILTILKAPILSMFNVSRITSYNVCYTKLLR